MRSRPNSPKSQTTTVILVRHGRSTFNDQGRYQGSSDDSVLTEKGIRTAQQVGQSLSETPVHAIYTSPLRRVQQTNQEILQAIARSVELNVSTDLREIDLPQWQGLTYQYVKQQFADAYACWQQRPHEFQQPTTNATLGNVALATKPAYPVLDLYRRAQHFWLQLMPRYQGQTVLVVAHGGTNHALISTALGFTPQHHHSLQQSNCGTSVLEFSGQGIVLKQLNQTAALGETLPKLKAGKQGLRLLLIPTEEIEFHLNSLAQRLSEIPVDFCLSTEQSRTRQILKNQPQTLHLSTQNENFLCDWRQTLAQSSQRAHSVMTGVAIAPRRSIQTLLVQTLGGSVRDHNKIHPGQLSVIHYPHAHRPIVQAVNI